MRKALLITDPLQKLRAKWTNAIAAGMLKGEKLLHRANPCGTYSFVHFVAESPVYPKLGCEINCRQIELMDKTIFSREQAALEHLLRQVRLGTGLRQEDLAARLDEPQSFVSKYETGERRIDLVELRQICRALGISLIDFVRRFDEACNEA